MANDARLKTLAVIFLLLLGAVIVRLLDLQIFRHDFFEKLSLKQRTRIIDLAASRGDVYDRNGEIMATSIDTYSLFRQEPHFAWVARKLPLAAAEQLKKAGSAEVFMIKEKNGSIRKTTWPPRSSVLSARTIRGCPASSFPMTGT